MGEMMNEGQNLGDNIDLSQFYQIFFEEAGENLDQMEQMLLQLDLEQADDEEQNEEGADVQVRRRLDVEATQALAPGELLIHGGLSRRAG